jgi:glycosyltransferase involved in cell wall biosynthesis
LYDRIHFLGFIGKEDRRNLLAATQLLALVSSAENFGMAAVEAMAAGVPVLVSDRVGVSTEIASDGAGKVVPPRQDAIAQALIELLLNPLLLNQMGKKAQMSALKRYDIRAVAKQMLIALEDVLTGRRSPDLNWSDNQCSVQRIND